jgi:hypothetical protein
MHSAYWRGVTLLQELNSSDPEVGQHHGPAVAPVSPSKDTEEGFTEVLKNVTLLKPVIKKLRAEVAHAVI